LSARDVLRVPEICTQEDADHDESGKVLAGCDFEDEISLLLVPYKAIGANLNTKNMAIPLGSHSS
jgi:hypothetical protein